MVPNVVEVNRVVAYARGKTFLGRRYLQIIKCVGFVLAHNQREGDTTVRLRGSQQCVDFVEAVLAYCRAVHSNKIAAPVHNGDFSTITEPTSARFRNSNESFLQFAWGALVSIEAHGTSQFNVRSSSQDRVNLVTRFIRVMFMRTQAQQNPGEAALVEESKSIFKINLI